MMMKENKVYTKTGDDGTTSLNSGLRVKKHHIRVAAYGSIDELNAWVGLIRDTTADILDREFLMLLQNHLMVLGTQLSTVREEDLPTDFIDPINDPHILEIENEIDRISMDLPPLKNFVLPGGHPLVSYSHLARCVCRRAERHITELNANERVSPYVIAFVNRLSDYFFVLSRKFSLDLDLKENKWIPKEKKRSS
ncbi:MAG: cob(I)yrinic acid a,c-diamide adenosyltransferase [Flavobacteriaceae bacterium]|nr:cob(I)yrinic acid a,c-diamide adenosyltransferase [Flavobacteriaceae bacterium]